MGQCFGTPNRMGGSVEKIYTQDEFDRVNERLRRAQVEVQSQAQEIADLQLRQVREKIPFALSLRRQKLKSK